VTARRLSAPKPRRRPTPFPVKDLRLLRRQAMPSSRCSGFHTARGANFHRRGLFRCRGLHPSLRSTSRNCKRDPAPSAGSAWLSNLGRRRAHQAPGENSPRKASPTGLVIVDPGTELDFLNDLPSISCGAWAPVTKARLAKIGVLTLEQLAKTPGWSLERLLGPAASEGAHAWHRENRGSDSYVGVWRRMR
jgi:hypothetical protein